MILVVIPSKAPQRNIENPTEKDVCDALWVLGAPHGYVALNRSKSAFLGMSRAFFEFVDDGPHHRFDASKLNPAEFYELAQRLMLSYWTGTGDWKSRVCWGDSVGNGNDM